jgi:hypothetical protein
LLIHLNLLFIIKNSKKLIDFLDFNLKYLQF